MRWFVEVTRVGDSAPTERYCVEAKAWQAALQDTRKLRGDAGPLSKFSIELLDDGYRAVDPVQKVRYLVNQAPADAPLVTAPSNGAHASSPNASPAPPAAAAVSGTSPAKLRPSIAPPAAAGAPLSSIASLRGVGASPAAMTDAGVPVVAAARLSSSAASAREPGRATESLIPRPAPRPGDSKAPPPAEAKARQPKPGHFPSTSPARLEPAPRDPKPTLELVPESQPAPAEVSAPAEGPQPPGTAGGCVAFLRRAEEPTPAAPITYREEAYSVPSGTERAAVEALLRERLAALRAELRKSPPGQLVQLAIFDHEFTDKPQRPPLGTLAWKDWRGEAVLGFPAFGDASPPLSSRMPPPPDWAAKAASVPQASNDARPSAPPSAGAASGSTAAAAPTTAPVTAPVAASASDAPSAAAVAASASDAPSAAPVAASASDAPSAAAVAASASDAPSAAPVTVSASTPAPSAPRASRPKLVVPRRRAGEDLIAELFEIMHELHFATDIRTGAEFLESVLDEVIPSDIVFIQVFDIDTRNFVVVRARGPGASKALLHATPDTDPQIAELMRRENARAIRPEGDESFSRGRWSYVTAKVSEVLAGPVRQGGRYLGVVEVANPLGGEPFHQTEINAMDYICAQFADFVAGRPVVLEPDVILGR